MLIFSFRLEPFAFRHSQIGNGLVLANNLPGYDFNYFSGTARLLIDNPLKESQTEYACRIGSN